MSMIEGLKKGALLTDGELEKVVDSWIDEDWSVRTVQLDRGHWEYIAPVIAKAQQDKDFKAFTNWLEARQK